MSKIPRSNYAKVPRRVAFHEAGHAVARVILGLPFEAVSVRKKPEEIMIIENGQEKYFDAIFNEGVILSQQLSDNIKEERLEGKLDLRDGISSMAGPDAEAMLIGERDEKAQEGALTDIIRITNSCRVAAEPGVPLEKLTHCEMENNIIQAL